MPLVVPLGKLGVAQVDDHAANPAEATSTTVAIARSTSSSSPGNCPSTQPGEDLLERAVDRPRSERGVAVGAHVAALARGFDHAGERAEHAADLVDRLAHLRRPRDLAHEHADQLRRHEPRAEIDPREPPQLLAERRARRLDPLRLRDEQLPRVAEDRLEHLVLRAEVVVEQPVRDARLLGDVADARRAKSLAREHPHRRVEKLLPPVGHGARSIIRPRCPRSTA